MLVIDEADPSFGLADFVFPVNRGVLVGGGTVEGLRAAGESLSGLASAQASLSVALLAEARPLLRSLSVVPLVSHGFAAVHRSTQLQPHCRLLGSRNIGFVDFEVLFH